MNTENSRERRGINWGESLVPALGIGFGLAYFIQVADAPFSVIKWPVMVAALTGICLFFVAAGHLFKPAPPKVAVPMPGDRLKPLLMCIVPVIYLVLMPYLGFFIGSLLFLTLLSRLLGGRSWFRNLGVALALVGTLYLLLVVFMKIPLPRLEIGTLVL